MKPPESDGSPAKVLAAAFRTWTTVDADPEPAVARLEIRYPPDWAFASTNSLTARQQKRLLAFLRDDLAENRPGYSTPNEPPESSTECSPNSWQPDRPASQPRISPRPPHASAGLAPGSPSTSPNWSMPASSPKPADPTPSESHSPAP